ncbi:hypothetical protein [Aquamicrobium sp.]|uniref:hypothetical protein n=1 Tax=Aquamicrobium sp. TaxID=1872579 RepID=UPI002583CBA5|nr:hypothetical protein [Aquamicrobium sp.]MCK9553633.1 hypothetical protein [Aquamicrobium sp.]
MVKINNTKTFFILNEEEELINLKDLNNGHRGSIKTMELLEQEPVRARVFYMMDTQVPDEESVEMEYLRLFEAKDENCKIKSGIFTPNEVKKIYKDKFFVNFSKKVYVQLDKIRILSEEDGGNGKELDWYQTKSPIIDLLAHSWANDFVQVIPKKDLPKTYAELEYGQQTQNNEQGE